MSHRGSWWTKSNSIHRLRNHALQSRLLPPPPRVPLLQQNLRENTDNFARRDSVAAVLFCSGINPCKQEIGALGYLYVVATSNWPFTKQRGAVASRPDCSHGMP